MAALPPPSLRVGGRGEVHGGYRCGMYGAKRTLVAPYPIMRIFFLTYKKRPATLTSGRLDYNISILYRI